MNVIFSHESHMWKLLLFFESIIQKETYTLINNVCMCSFEKDTYISQQSLQYWSWNKQYLVYNNSRNKSMNSLSPPDNFRRLFNFTVSITESECSQTGFPCCLYSLYFSVLSCYQLTCLPMKSGRREERRGGRR